MGLPQLVGLRCVCCGAAISSITEGSFCRHCGNPAHHHCLRPDEAGLRDGRCACCGGDPMLAPPEAREELGLPALGPAASRAAAAVRCARCGSDRVVPQARIPAEGEPKTLQVIVDARPDALLFKGRANAGLYARVCADCGAAELYVKRDSAERLYEAYQKCQSASE